MARIKFGMMMTDARGKLGGHVFSKNRSGAYIRTKVTPVNPRTVDQQLNRSILGTLSQAWSGLTESERGSWNGAVDSWSKTNIFGDNVKPSGKALFVGLNKNAMMIGSPMLTEAPARIEMTPIFGASASYDVSSALLTLAGEAGTDESVVVVSATPQLSAGTTFVKGKFRKISQTTDLTSAGAAVKADYIARFGTPALGTSIYFEFKKVHANGQMSVPVVVKLDIIP